MPKKAESKQETEFLHTQKTKAVRKQQSKKCKDRYIRNAKDSMNINSNRRTNLRYAIFICYIDGQILQKKLQVYLDKKIMKNKCFKAHLYKLQLFQRLGGKEKAQVFKEIINRGKKKFQSFLPQDKIKMEQDKNSILQLIKAFDNNENIELIKQKFKALYKKSRKQQAQKIFEAWEVWRNTPVQEQPQEISNANLDNSSEKEQMEEEPQLFNLNEQDQNDWEGWRNAPVQEQPQEIPKGSSQNEEDRSLRSLIKGDFINDNEWRKMTFSSPSPIRLSASNLHISQFSQDERLLEKEFFDDERKESKKKFESIEMPHHFSKDDICKNPILEITQRKRSKLRQSFLNEQ